MEIIGRGTGLVGKKEDNQDYSYASVKLKVTNIVSRMYEEFL